MMVLVLSAGFVFLASAQETLSASLPADRVEARLNRLRQRIGRQTGRVLERVRRREDRSLRKLARTDPARAAMLRASAEEQRKQLQPGKGPGSAYDPDLDSLSTALRFMEAAGARQSLAATQEKLAATEAVQKYLQQRKAAWQGALGPDAAPFKAFAKEAWYFRAQVSEARALLTDRKRRERKAWALLRSSEAFRDFFNRHSEAASLFSVPPATDPAQALAGLQTRGQVQAAVTAAVGSPEGARQLVQERLDAAKGALQQVKNKLQPGVADPDLPGFKPNTQRAKSFFRRLELGANFQHQRGSGLLPLHSDIGLSLGYKFSDKAVAGIGAAFRLGWGKGFDDLRLSGEGLGLRSFGEWRLKGSFWLAGGYEWNYLARIDKLNTLTPPDRWQQSALLGLSKRYRLGKKGGSLQLLYDFRAARQLPATPALKFRVGYRL